ncbi:unnamed protein product [Schistocephalus solidus]|uniref:C2H2-type domain-containing protein n=1 Tax=Schistocephalus solidus TaxID=70667 RepID=A0A183SF19_SCHSO|nr:unnamed protein product [Schistocephalus solidus]
MRCIFPVPSTESYIEKGLINCTHVFVRCDHVRKPLEQPYEGPFRVLSRNAKTCQILRGDKEDVVGVDRVKAAVVEEPPDLPQGQDLLTPTPCTFNFPTRSSILPTLSTYPTFSYPPPDPNSSSSNDICNIRSGRRVHFPDCFITQALTLHLPSASFAMNSSCPTPTTSVATFNFLSPATSTLITPIPSTSDGDSALTCLDCDRNFNSHIGLGRHLRIHRTETGELMPGAPTQSRYHHLQ